MLSKFTHLGYFMDGSMMRTRYTVQSGNCICYNFERLRISGYWWKNNWELTITGGLDKKKGAQILLCALYLFTLGVSPLTG